MKEFVEYVVKALVDYPDEVVVHEVDGERTVIFELHLNKTDIGKVIGKNGCTIDALRSVVTSVAAKEGRRVSLEIIEDEEYQRPEKPPQPA